MSETWRSAPGRGGVSRALPVADEARVCSEKIRSNARAKRGSATIFLTVWVVGSSWAEGAKRSE